MTHQVENGSIKGCTYCSYYTKAEEWGISGGEHGIRVEYLLLILENYFFCVQQYVHIRLSRSAKRMVFLLVRHSASMFDSALASFVGSSNSC